MKNVPRVWGILVLFSGIPSHWIIAPWKTKAETIANAKSYRDKILKRTARVVELVPKTKGEAR